MRESEKVGERISEANMQGRNFASKSGGYSQSQYLAIVNKLSYLLIRSNKCEGGSTRTPCAPVSYAYADM